MIPTEPSCGLSPQGVAIPAASVCIPAFNAEAFLGEALASVQNQTFSDWELIVVDDGSRDSTHRIVERFSSRMGQPVLLLRHQSNRGLPAARNSALQASNGEFIAMLDADDRWAPSHLATCIQVANRTEADAVFSGAQEVNDKGEIVSTRLSTEYELATLCSTLFHRCPFFPSATVLRKSVVLAAGSYNEELPYCDDLDLWFRLARMTVKCSSTGHPTVYYRRHLNSMSAKSLEMAFYRARVLDENYDEPSTPEATKRVRRARAWFNVCMASGRQSFRFRRYALRGLMRSLAGAPPSPYDTV